MATPNTGSVPDVRNDEHWQSSLAGHGLVYFRELVVEYRTLQWTNPFAAAADAARKDAEAKKLNVTNAEAAIAKAQGVPDPALKKVLEDAKAAAMQAEKNALIEEQRKTAADNARAAAEKLIENLIARFERNEAIWGDILEFESALLRLLPLEKLKARYNSLAAEYEGVTGVPAPTAPSDEASLRPLAETVLADLHWAYTTGPVQERQKGRLIVFLVLATGAVLASIVLFLGIMEAFFDCTIIAWIAVAGTVGAALSAFQRIQNRGLKGDVLTNCDKSTNCDTPWLQKIKEHLLTCGSFVAAPLIGAISAVLLGYIFASGLVSGAAFPKFNSSLPGTNTLPGTTALLPVNTNIPAASKATQSTNTVSISTNTSATNAVLAGTPSVSREAAASSSTNRSEPSPVFTQTNGSGSNMPPPALPAHDPVQSKPDCQKKLWQCWCSIDCVNFALLLVWGFVAGFSERLVPDIITRLTEKAEKAAAN